MPSLLYPWPSQYVAAGLEQITPTESMCWFTSFHVEEQRQELLPPISQMRKLMVVKVKDLVAQSHMVNEKTEF